MRLLAVDPGVRACGWALIHLLDDGTCRHPGRQSGRPAYEKIRLEGCGLVQSKALGRDDMAHFAAMSAELSLVNYDRLVVERPQLYRESKQKGRQEDLARLLILCGMICGVVHDGHGELVLPHDWKGGIPKPDPISDIDSYIVHRRNKEALGDYLPRDVSLGKAHNVVDAVGLGLWRVRQLLTDLSVPV